MSKIKEILYDALNVRSEDLLDLAILSRIKQLEYQEYYEQQNKQD